MRHVPRWEKRALLLPELQEEYDLDQKIETGKLIDAAGAGQSMFSPGWLTQLGQLWGGKSVRPPCSGRRSLLHHRPP